MLVAVGVWFTRRIARAMRVLVMRIVDVPVFMLHLFVVVLMFMPLDEMQVEADAHEHGCSAELRTDRL